MKSFEEALAGLPEADRLGVALGHVAREWLPQAHQRLTWWEGSPQNPSPLPSIERPAEPLQAAWRLVEIARSLRHTPSMRRAGVVDTPRRLAHLVASGIPSGEAPLIDLCCGPGALLLAAAERRLERGDSTLRALRTLYGVDMDPLAVATCRLVIALVGRTLSAEALDALLGQIQQGDALAPLDSYASRAPEVMAAGGFGVVVANPPYARARQHKRSLEGFETLWGAFDLFVPFIERGVSLLRRGGRAIFLTSNKYFVADYGKKLRAHLLNKASLRVLLDLSHDPAFDVQIEAAITVVDQGREGAGAPVVAHAQRALPEGALTRLLSLEPFGAIDTPDLRAERHPELPWTPGGAASPWAIKALAARRERIERLSHTQRLGERFVVRTGVMGFAYRNALSHLVEATSTETRVVTPALLRAFRFCWGARSVRLGNTIWSRPALPWRPEEIGEMSWARLHASKVIVPGVSSVGLCAAADSLGQYAPLVAVHMVMCDPEAAPALAALLNSLPLRWFFFTAFSGARIPQGSQRISVGMLRISYFSATSGAWSVSTFTTSIRPILV